MKSPNEKRALKRKPRLSQFTSLTISTYALGLVVTFLVVYTAIDFYRHPNEIEKGSLRSYVRSAHEKTIDLRLLDRGPAQGSNQIAILAIDDETLRLEGRWPWPREKTARLIDRTLMYGAKSVSFDMVFSEPDNNSALPAVSRLEKVLRDSKLKNKTLSDALSEEVSKADADKVFATTIRAHQDSLVMGSFYMHEMSGGKASDLCLDAYYSRTYPSRYWKKEALPFSVVDGPLSQLNYPRNLEDHLNGYFTQLEVDAATVWFSKNEKVIPKLKVALAEYGALNDADLFPGLGVLVANNDFESGTALLEGTRFAASQETTIREIYSKYATSLDAKETADLYGSIRGASLKYCERFFTPRDELSSIDVYSKKWGDSAESTEGFDSYSWANYWNRLPGASGSNVSTKETSTAAIARINSEILPNSLPMTLRWELNIPTLAEATKHSGYFNAVQDVDGSIRRTRLITRFANTHSPSLVLKTFLLNSQMKLEAQISAGEDDEDHEARILKSLTATEADGKRLLTIPVDSTGHLLVNYSGPQNMFPHLRATDILSDSDSMQVVQHVRNAKTGEWADETTWVSKQKFLKDKVLFFGVTAIGVFDLRVTPFDGNFPGVETHANALSNLFIERARNLGAKVDPSAPGFLRTSPHEETIMGLVLIVLGFVFSGFIAYYGSIAGLFIALGTIGAVYFFDKYYFFQEGIVVASLFPMALVILQFVTLTFYKYFTEEKTKRELKTTFEKYVSPAIVNEVLADPENVELGGKKVNLTVMFSDVRGFTTISEKLDPRELSDLLNSYLTPMTNLVFANRGTLDKYMGDAIMAFWGAPVHFPDHAVHAARCALQMLEKLKVLQAEYRAKGLPEIDIGIGLNTGEMSVGNMGSDTVRSYTVMGDAVNLGSRLEGINKTYGTRIIISEFTYLEVKKHFICREIDWVTVKGKNIPVRIYELMAERPNSGATAFPPGPDRSVLIRNFEEGFQLYHEQRFADAQAFFKRALQVDPHDAPSQLYLERCGDYITTPPPPGWDGVYAMKTK